MGSGRSRCEPSRGFFKTPALTKYRTSRRALQRPFVGGQPIGASALVAIGFRTQFDRLLGGPNRANSPGDRPAHEFDHPLAEFRIRSA
jgi:hypothetical protein